MAEKKHQHKHCKHAHLQYCLHCQKPHCLDCGEEWNQQVVKYEYLPNYPNYTWPHTTWTYYNTTGAGVTTDNVRIENATATLTTSNNCDHGGTN